MGSPGLTKTLGGFPFLLLRFCFLLILVVRPSTSENGDESTPTSQKDGTLGEKTKFPTKIINLAESINRSQKGLQDPERAKASREQWELALKDIKELLPDPKKTANETAMSRDKGSFSQWKLLLEKPNSLELDPETNLTMDVDNFRTERGQNSKIARFEGFASWERLLQDWADDIQDYMDKIEAENTEYPLATHGAPTKRRKSTISESPKTEPVETHAVIDGSTRGEAPLERHKEPIETLKEPRVNKKSINLPIPAPAQHGEKILPHTDISDKSKQIWIVTTAALPWMTGTAVNPLLRAAYMTEGRKEAGGSVTLMLPWLERQQDQASVYGADEQFDSPKHQEAFIRDWLRHKAKMPQASEQLNIEWYTAWQNKAENSLYSMGDITALIPADKVDICILEEPEHLNWYRAPGEAWTDKFKHVVGIIHTNYFVYAQEQPAAFIRAPGMRLLCSWMCRSHCHRLIKLSGTLGRFAPEKELVENVHGVRGSFLETGEEVRKRLESPKAAEDPVFSADSDPSVYFIGKMLWSKGLASLMELLKYAEESAGIQIRVDMYGGGPDKDAATSRAKSLGVDMEFHGPIDHAELGFSHKIFLNPSTSEVLCTTVAEALAMGKFVVVPSHPSNDFFAQFPNCLTYANKEEFVGNLYYALTHSPAPLTNEDAYALSWRAATKRLEAAGSIPEKEAELKAKALSSNEAGFEISLPPLIEDDKTRKSLATRLEHTRNRYRQFRSRLSQEIKQNSKVFPSGVAQRLTNELDKRLDLDIDEELESPKLRLQLSPAELDKRLLKLYKNIVDGPRGDVLRIIGGGQEVALQDLYIKTHALRDRAKDPKNQTILSFGPFEALDDDSDDTKRTASQWVNWALRRNLPRGNVPINRSHRKSQGMKTGIAKNKDEGMTMSLFKPSPFDFRRKNLAVGITFTSANQFCPPRRSMSSFSILI